MSTNSVGQIFAASLFGGGIFTIDAKSGVTTELFADVTGGGGLTAIAFDENDTLYGITLDSNNFIRIDLATAASTIIGPLPFDDIRGLAAAAPTTITEPSTMLLLGSGLIDLVGYERKKFFKK